MKILIMGASGQLGQELIRTAPADWTIQGLTRQDLDLTDEVACRRVVGAFAPHWVINAAAYTRVDLAESESALAFAVNRDGVAALARAAREEGAGLVQLSTDFVFDGKQGRPYRSDDPIAPLGVYGASKAAGEAAVRTILAEGQWLILRTAWLYAGHGQNFVRTMLRLLRERERIGVVADQVGSPTWARGLAEGIWLALARGVTGIHHWTDAGVASWYDLAVATQEEAAALGLLPATAKVFPITTADYPTPAQRPEYSVLDKVTTWRVLEINDPNHWRVALRQMLREM